MKVLVGTEKKSHRMTERDKKITAYHEAGHAVTSYYLEHKDPVTHISIVRAVWQAALPCISLKKTRCIL